MIGKTISHYRILGEIGRGGMGVVYKAEDTKLRRIVALKFLPPELTRDQEAKKRFIHEAQAASSLDHPNVCTIYEVEETGDGRIFMAMPFYEGETLKRRIERGPLAVEEAVHIAVQAAEGLKDAHTHGIVHRDIKSANIMIPSRGQAKILDFGLAMLSGRTRLTKTGSTLGTAPYMSPEQIRGEKADPRSDIWSLGVVLYEMLTGRLPFKGDYDQAVAYNIVNECPDPVTGLRTGVPPELDRIIGKCLEKDPSKRYQHIEDLAVDLKALSESRSGNAVQPLPARGARMRKWPVPAAGILGVILIMLFLDPLNRFGPKTVPAVSFEKKILFIPLENLGPEEEDYFAEGVTEEIISRLASLHTLGVISRQSALHYVGKEVTTAEIGKELGVHYILTGTLRWAVVPGGAQRVRITPHLIRVKDDIEIWSRTYEHILEDIFQTQSDIAQNVVEALGMTLEQPHREKFAEQPTENLDAYQAYLRGRWFTRRPHFSVEDWQKAIDNYRSAVSLDSRFALAYAELARAHARMYYLRHDVSEKRLRLADEAAGMAVRLNPASADVRLALGYYHLWAYRDRRGALREWTAAEKEMPNNVDILLSKADLYEPMGRWDDAIKVLKQAVQISPRDSEIPSRLALFHWWTRKYDLAAEYADRAVTLGPDEVWPYLYKTFIHWSREGMDAASRASLSEAPMSRDHEWYLWSWFYQYTGEGRFQDALDLLESTPVDWVRHKLVAYPKPLMAAFIYNCRGEGEKAAQFFGESVPILRSALEKYPNDPRYHSALGMALAGSGSKEEGIGEGRKAVELLPLSVDHAYGIAYVSDLAVTYILAGEAEAALEQLEILLREPTWFSPALLRGDIRHAPLHEHPGYRELLDKYRGESD